MHLIAYVIYYGFVLLCFLFLLRTIVFVLSVYTLARTGPQEFDPELFVVTEYEPELLPTALCARMEGLVEACRAYNDEPFALYRDLSYPHLIVAAAISAGESEKWVFGSTIFSLASPRRHQFASVFNEITTDFVDGSMISTNSSEKHPTADLGTLHIWSFPSCKSLDALITIHEALVEDAGKQIKPPPRTKEEYDAMIEPQRNAGLDGMLLRGEAKRTGQGQYRYTWRIYIRAFYESYAPRLSRKRKIRRSRAKLRQLGLAHLWKTAPDTVPH